MADTLRTDRQTGDTIDAADINAIATFINRLRQNPIEGVPKLTQTQYDALTIKPLPWLLVQPTEVDPNIYRDVVQRLADGNVSDFANVGTTGTGWTIKPVTAAGASAAQLTLGTGTISIDAGIRTRIACDPSTAYTCSIDVIGGTWGTTWRLYVYSRTAANAITGVSVATGDNQSLSSGTVKTVTVPGFVTEADAAYLELRVRAVSTAPSAGATISVANPYAKKD